MTVSLVIGAAGGVGLEVTRGLLKRGNTVIATVLNDAEEKLLHAEAPGVTAIHHVNLGNADDTLKAVQGIAAGLKVLNDVAVCAAISPLGPTEYTTVELLRRTIEINTISQVALGQAVLPKLRESKGRLLYITSMSGKLGLPFIGVYTASKHALEGIVDTWRQEVSPSGVKIILVEPGGIKTPMVKAQLEQVAEMIATLTPETDALYGNLYRGFQRAATEAYNGDGSTPAQVAAVVIEGLTAETPQTRYIAGDDAKQLLGARHNMSDLDFDAVLSKFFGV